MAAATAAAEAAPRVDYWQLFVVIAYPMLVVLLGSGLYVGGALGGLRGLARRYAEKFMSPRQTVAQQREQALQQGAATRTQALEESIREPASGRRVMERVREAEEMNRAMAQRASAGGKYPSALTRAQVNLRKSPGRAQRAGASALSKLLRMKEKAKATYKALKPDRRDALTRLIEERRREIATQQ